MTTKQAIKARCRDCLAGARECTFTDCALKGLAKSKQGANRLAAIKAYCRWCLNGHYFSVCASPDCGIYQYRTGNSKPLNLPSKPHNSGILCNSKSKKVKSYGKGFPAPVNAVMTAPEGNQSKEKEPA